MVSTTFFHLEQTSSAFLTSVEIFAYWKKIKTDCTHFDESFLNLCFGNMWIKLVWTIIDHERCIQDFHSMQNYSNTHFVEKFLAHIGPSNKIELFRCFCVLHGYNQWPKESMFFGKICPSQKCSPHGEFIYFALFLKENVFSSHTQNRIPSFDCVTEIRISWLQIHFFNCFCKIWFFYIEWFIFAHETINDQYICCS